MTSRCQSFAARQWLSARPVASTLLLGTPSVEARDAGEGRGLGLFATQPIAAFSQILCDTPLILMKPNDDLPELYKQFANLPKEDQERYLSLSQHADLSRDALLKDKLLQRGFGTEGLEEMANVAGIMQTNAFNVDLHDGQGPRHRALFPSIARINHSCAPNAHVCFYPPNGGESRGRMTVHALNKLESGAEILISYFNILLPRSERQAKTQKWGFTCLCTVCADTDGAETQREAIRTFNADQSRLVQRTKIMMKEVNAIMEKGESLADLLKDQTELYPALPDIFEHLGMLQAKGPVVQKRHRGRDKLLALLEQAVIWEARITGVSSPATRRRLRQMAQFEAEGDNQKAAHIAIDGTGNYVVQWND
ncbi:SET domain-containing [Lecanosticta acicola]|uniref:SET domain-containing n=1 Tax=Lecanosticta acicola TaxID=111012 RepID=A0AAI8Z504_9PEZI|nr:SET domain-containing [Lecanosticta acicola]